MTTDGPIRLRQGPRGLEAALAPEAGFHPLMSRSESLAWAEGLAGTLVLDLARTPHLDAVLAAWLFQLVQVARPTALIVRGASAHLRDQFARYQFTRWVRLHGGHFAIE